LAAKAYWPAETKKRRPAVASYEVVHAKPKSFYRTYERKGGLQHQTHLCPGCGHGTIHKLLALAIDSLGIQDRTILVGPVGCSVFTYYYYDVGNISAAHGRAPAVAAAAKRSRPESIVIEYQGDGDLAAIGTAEIIHAANRGDGITVIFVNNGIYGMTGGQMAPTTPLGSKSTTSPFGRSLENDGPPLRVCELLSSLDAPVFIERVVVGSTKEVMHASKVIRKAVENQVKGLGFSFVEVLSPCPTIWKMDPNEAKRHAREEMAAVFPPGNFRDRTREATPFAPRPEPPTLDQIPGILGLEVEDSFAPARQHANPDADMRIRIAGFGGQGVLMLGEVLAEAGLQSGYDVSWLPSYGPEMRSGTSNCHVRLRGKPVDTPLVEQPNVLIAFNEPSLRKFLPSVEPGGLVLFAGESIPHGCQREGISFLAVDCTSIADELGSARAGNIVMLGVLLELSHLLEQEPVEGALRKLIKGQRWLELDLKALAAGSAAARAASDCI
jgi:2-oxoisovalerate ferredoxin oxidoreductase beta subunit